MPPLWGGETPTSKVGRLYRYSGPHASNALAEGSFTKPSFSMSPKPSLTVENTGGNPVRPACTHPTTHQT